MDKEKYIPITFVILVNLLNLIKIEESPFPDVSLVTARNEMKTNESDTLESSRYIYIVYPINF